MCQEFFNNYPGAITGGNPKGIQQQKVSQKAKKRVDRSEFHFKICNCKKKQKFYATRLQKRMKLKLKFMINYFRFRFPKLFCALF